MLLLLPSDTYSSLEVRTNLRSGAGWTKLYEFTVQVKESERAIESAHTH